MLAAAGCGYTTRANQLPSHISTIYIAPLTNATDQPNIESNLRAELTAVFQNDGNLRVVNAESEADSVLRGSVSGYDRQAVRYQDDKSVQEYRLVISLDFEFLDTGTQKALVRENKFSGDTSFYLAGSKAISESTARDNTLKDLSRRVLNRIVTLW